MFRSRRNALVKRLWKHRLLVNEDETACQVESEVKFVVQNMLKRLKETQLELLVQSVESRGCDVTGCVLVPRGDLRLGRRTLPPHVLCCQLWRWPDVRQPFELKWLHWCDAANDPLYICCNPYHWSRLCKPESPPPPYTRHPQELKPEDRILCDACPTEARNLTDYRSYPPSYPTTGDNGVSNTWCSIAYWELRTRVGRLFPVTRNSVNVFSELPHGDGLCLATLADLNKIKTDSVLRTRDKIGLGVTISRESEGVWLYNRSDHPVFVNSPTLDQPNARTLTVYKVQPGYSIKIFDYRKSEYYRSCVAAGPAEQYDGPVDPNSVRVSFAKGWGPKYSRQFITSCPCWLEVLLTSPPR